MSAARSIRRIAPVRAAEATARVGAGEVIDRLTPDAGIVSRIANLAASEDPIDRIFAVRLSRDPGLHEFVAVEANREGQSSFTGKVARALRDRYLRELDKMITAETPELAKTRTGRAMDLAAAVNRYVERNWPRDHQKGNSHSQYDIDERKK